LIKAQISPEESILHNLDTWCYEVGSDFEEMGRQAALDCIGYLTTIHVLDLGCGDGASTRAFVENNIYVLAVDINYEKLQSIPMPAVKWELDMLTALRTLSNNSVHNVFAHHSLEHVVNVDEVLIEIARVIRPEGLFYAVVPADDTLHSVHHVVFETPEELSPPGFKIIKAERQTRNEPEFICIAQSV